MLGRKFKIASLLLVLTLVAAAETIPAGTHVTVRTNSTLNSATARSGQSFNANLVRDLTVNGQTLAKAGSPVKGKVTYAKSSGRLHVPGQLTLRLTAVEINGKMTPITTGGFFAKGRSHTKSNVVAEPQRAPSSAAWLAEAKALELAHWPGQAPEPESRQLPENRKLSCRQKPRSRLPQKPTQP
jgi:hypothetical protein